MSDDTTRASLRRRGTSTSAGTQRILVIAHHPDATTVGTWRAIPTSEGVIGRAGGLFDEATLGHTPGLSRAHVGVRLEDSAVIVRDLGSRNGTLVDGHPVEVAQVDDGAVIEAGDMLLVVITAPNTFVTPCNSRLLGIGPRLAETLAEIEKVAARGSPVLIQGETGVGKELVAAELHRLSCRPGPFVPVNMGGIAPALVQSELFGHVRGAFSGADSAAKGLVVHAERGTLFLDEIGDAPPDVQVSLLRVLQEREVRAVGAHEGRKVDVRFVAATHRELGELVRRGTFREDLFFRLSRWVVRVPPLRERREDLPTIATAMARRFAETPVMLSPRVCVALMRHGWPGNVRELASVVEHLVADRTDATLVDGPPWLTERLATSRETPLATVPGDLSAGVRSKFEDASRSVMKRPTRDAVTALLAEVDFNVTAAARQLGVSRSTLYRWFGELGIDPDALRDR